MPKLIIDEEARELICSKLAGQPIYSGPDGKFLSPRIIDIVDSDNDYGRWQPGNEGSRLLVLCGEACRDLIFQAERFKDKVSRNRTIKAMTVPLCSLMDNINRLITLLNHDDRAKKIRFKWPEHDIKNYKNIGKQLRKKHLHSPVRKIRNKLAAHLDQDIFIEQKIQLSLEIFLEALGDSLILMNLLINHADTFTWIRWIETSEEEKFQLCETFYGFPICTRWVTDLEGKVIDIDILQLADDPRFEIQEDLIEAVKMYNTLVDQSKLSGSQVSKIWIKPSTDLYTNTH